MLEIKFNESQPSKTNVSTGDIIITDNTQALVVVNCGFADSKLLYKLVSMDGFNRWDDTQCTLEEIQRFIVDNGWTVYRDYKIILNLSNGLRLHDNYQREAF